MILARLSLRRSSARQEGKFILDNASEIMGQSLKAADQIENSKLKKRYDKTKRQDNSK